MRAGSKQAAQQRAGNQKKGNKKEITPLGRQSYLQGSVFSIDVSRQISSWYPKEITRAGWIASYARRNDTNAASGVFQSGCQFVSKADVTNTGQFHERLPDRVDQIMLYQQTPKPVRAFVQV